MNIAMFTNNYKPFIGGVPISIERLSEGLRNLNHNVYIFAPTYPQGHIDDEFVIRYKSHKGKMLYGKFVIPYAFDPKIEKQFKKLNIDIIHVHHPIICGWMGIYLGKKYNIPVIFTYHTRYEQYLHNVKWFNKLENIVDNGNKKIITNVSSTIVGMAKKNIIPKYITYFSNKCDQIFAPTATIKEYLEQTDVIRDITIIPTGIQDNFFNINKKIIDGIRSTYIGDKKFLFCSVSRISKEKNIKFILDGLHILKNNIGNCFRLIIIGDGPERNNMEEYVKKLGLLDNIVFLGSVPNNEISNYYKASDLFLFSSKSETQGVVLLEAMSSSTPVIAIRASGVQDVVENHLNGFMSEDNIQNWADYIQFAVQNPITFERLKEGAYRTATLYSSENISKLVENTYKKTIGKYKNNKISKEEIRYKLFK